MFVSLYDCSKNHVQRKGILLIGLTLSNVCVCVRLQQESCLEEGNVIDLFNIVKCLCLSQVWTQILDKFLSSECSQFILLSNLFLFIDSVIGTLFASCQAKEYENGILCFSAKYVTFWSKDKDRLAWIRDNVSERSDMSTC